MDREGFVLRFIVMWFFEEDDDEEQKEKLGKVKNYAEEVVPLYNDRHFQQHFRMKPETFEHLLTKLNARGTVGRAGDNEELSTEKQLLVTLWYLANIESYRGVADRFGISISTAWHCVYKICHKLIENNHIYHIIAFPNGRTNQITNEFAQKCGFPGVVGAIDGSHIPIKAPKENAASYINRQSFHSILLQGVCDAQRRFLDCYTGEAGSVHDACMFRRSDLGQRLEHLQLAQDEHFIGDSAYPLLNKLIVPYRDTGHLGAVEINFNKKLSKTRVVIENAFALLKGRFRRLKLMETVRMDLMPVMIIAACILHNVCLEKNDIPVDVNVEAEMEEERLMQPEHNEIIILHEQRNNVYAQRKRYNIANLLYVRQNIQA